MALMRMPDGSEKLFISAGLPEKHLLLSDSLERALFRGELDTLNLRQVCDRYLHGRSKSYAESAVRYCLRWLVDHGYELPYLLAKEI